MECCSPEKQLVETSAQLLGHHHLRISQQLLTGTKIFTQPNHFFHGIEI